MSITPLSTTPNSVTRPSTFDADVDTHFAELPVMVTEINATLVAMQALAAGGAVSLQYIFSTTTTDSDPGVGALRLDNATQSSATTIRADLTGADGSDLSGVLALLDDSTSTNKGYLTLRHADTPTKWLVFSVLSLAALSGYKNITVTCVASSAASPFTTGDAILLDFSPTGDKGDPNVNASGLVSATTTVVVGGATAPSAGQVLRATSTTAADWETLVGVTASLAIQVDQTVTAWTRDATTTLGTTLNGTLSDTSTTITAFNGVAGVTYHCRALGVGAITHHATDLIITQTGASIAATVVGDTFDVEMLTASTCRIKNYVLASGHAVAETVYASVGKAIAMAMVFGG